MQTDEWRSGAVEERLEYALVKVSCGALREGELQGRGPSSLPERLEGWNSSQGDALDPFPPPAPSGPLGSVHRHFCVSHGWEVLLDPVASAQAHVTKNCSAPNVSSAPLRKPYPRPGCCHSIRKQVLALLLVMALLGKILTLSALVSSLVSLKHFRVLFLGGF